MFVDGHRAAGPSPLGRILVDLPEPPGRSVTREPIAADLAVNPGVPGFPVADASSTASPGSIADAIDGRLWFFPENPIGWSPANGRASAPAWYSVDFGQRRKIATVDLYFYGDELQYKSPASYTV